MKLGPVFLIILFLISGPLLIAGDIDSSMVLIPGGEFEMGKGHEKGYDYSPAHTVKIDSFYMDNQKVTNAEYFQFCTKTGYKLPEFWNTDLFKCGEKYPNYPVVGISWMDATKYAEWAGKRLPTEAEWEYAARGGLINKDYPNGNEWTKERAVQKTSGWQNLTSPVKKQPPNGYGLYDMSGNVWEWVADYYSADYYSESEFHNPTGPKTGTFRVIRGGSWHSGPMCKKVYFRKGLPGPWCDFAVGFRCVKDINPINIIGKENFHLFLLAGQSNMAGRGIVTQKDKEIFPRVFMLSKEGKWLPAVDPIHYDKKVAGVGLGRSFAKALAEKSGDIIVGLVPAACGGSPISSWGPGGYHNQTDSYPYDDAIKRAKHAMKDGVLKGVLWHQGESDSHPERAGDYQQKLVNLIQRFRQDLDDSTLPFIIGQMGQFPENTWNDFKKIVNDAQLRISENGPNIGFVPSNGLSCKEDKVHFTAESLREFGKRYAKVYFDLEK